MNEKIMRAFGLGDMVDAVHAGNCPFCKKPVNVEDFKDAISRREFAKSGICQPCQDSFFDQGEEE